MDWWGGVGTRGQVGGGWKGFVDGEWRSGWWKEATWGVVVEVKESGFEMCAR